MPDMSLSMSLEDRPDDLPKTLRNPGLRTSSEPPMQAEPTSFGRVGGQSAFALDASRTTVTDIKIPFWRLVILMMKVALASIPALVLATVLLWSMADVIGHLFPSLQKVNIIFSPTDQKFERRK